MVWTHKIVRRILHTSESWGRVCEKFENLAQPYADQDLRRRIIDTVQGLENNTVKDLTELIAQVRIPDH